MEEFYYNLIKNGPDSNFTWNFCIAVFLRVHTKVNLVQWSVLGDFISVWNQIHAPHWKQISYILIWNNYVIKTVLIVFTLQPKHICTQTDTWYIICKTGAPLYIFNRGLKTLWIFVSFAWRMITQQFVKKRTVLWMSKNRFMAQRLMLLKPIFYEIFSQQFSFVYRSQTLEAIALCKPFICCGNS